MAISASCPNCGNKYEFTDDFAGRMLLCRQCKNTFEVPVPGGAEGASVEAAVMPAFPSMVMRSGRRLAPDVQMDEDEPGEITHQHASAGRICSILGILYLLSTLATGGLAMFFSCIPVAAKMQPTWNTLVVILWGAAGALFVMMMLYFICGGAIRNGGLVAAWFMLLLTVIQLVGSICGLGNQAYRIFNGGALVGIPTAATNALWTGMAVGVIMLLLHAGLFLSLVSIVTRRRPRKVRRVQARRALA